jgi:hypothetical protein
MAETQQHRGGCHCGAVRYAVDLDLTQPVVQCNCSICSKRGWLLAFAPRSAFRLEAGDRATTDYQFGKKTIHHRFCATCGVASWGHGASPDGAEMVAVNVRCLDDVDIAALTIAPFDGKSL